MSMKNLADAFYEELRDVLSAEKQLTKAIPKMAKKASSKDLKKALENHLKETEKHIERVEAAFEETGKAPRAKKCEAMAGLIKEGEHVLKEEAEDEVKDVMIIAAAQKVEHYEIATYGTLCSWAELLGYANAKSLLGKNLEQEMAADEKLTQISSSLNPMAQEDDEEGEETPVRYNSRSNNSEASQRA